MHQPSTMRNQTAIYKQSIPVAHKEYIHNTHVQHTHTHGLEINCAKFDYNKERNRFTSCHVTINVMIS